EAQRSSPSVFFQQPELGVTSIKPLRDYLIQLGYTRSYGGVVQARSQVRVMVTAFICILTPPLARLCLVKR
ncbi:hypothetical protein ABC733_18055, partial [Mangrovibacter sp. SLW1]